MNPISWNVRRPTRVFRGITFLLLSLLVVPPMPASAGVPAPNGTAAERTVLVLSAGAASTQNMGAARIKIVLGAHPDAVEEAGGVASGAGSVLDYLGWVPPEDSVLIWLEDDQPTGGQLLHDGEEFGDGFDGFDWDADRGDDSLPEAPPPPAWLEEETAAAALNLPTEAPEGFAIPRAEAVAFNQQLNDGLRARAFDVAASFDIRYRRGAQVQHDEYGDGQVRRVDSDGDVWVSFENGSLEEVDPDDLRPADGDTHFDFLDQNGNTLSPHVLKGLILTRDIFVEQIRAYAGNLEQFLAGLLRDERVALYNDWSSPAAELQDLHDRSIGHHQRANLVAGGVRGVNVNQLTAEQRRGLDAEWQRAEANRLEEQFQALLLANPLLAIERDGVPLWRALAGDNAEYLEEHYSFLRDGELQHASLILDFINAEVERANGLGDDAEAENTVEDLWKYGTSQFTQQHQAASLLGAAVGSELPAFFIDETRSVVLASDAERDYERAAWSIGLGVVAGLSILIPGIGPFIAAGISSVEIYRDGSELIVVYGELESAEQTAVVTGYEHIETVRARADDAAGQFLLSLAGGALDFLDAGITSIRLLKTSRGGDEVVTAARVFDDAPPGWSATDDAWVLPNGAAAAVRTIEPDEAATLLGRLDEDALDAFPRRGEAGDADFFTSNGLQPQRTLEVGGRRYHISAPFRGPGNRTAVVAFEETAAGTLIPRTFYLSGEHGVWRVAVASSADLVHKGPHVPRDAAWNNLPRERVDDPETAGVVFANEGIVDTAAELQGPLSRWASEQGVRQLDDDVTTRAFFGHVEEAPPISFDTQGVGYDNTEFGGWVNEHSVSTPLPATARTPDFDGGPLDQWTFEHHLYGEVDGFLFPSTDGSVLFVVLRDGDGKVWVPSIQDADSGLTPFGTRYSAFDVDDLDATPLTHTERPVPTEPGTGLRPDGNFERIFENDLNQQFHGRLPEDVTNVPVSPSTPRTAGGAGPARSARNAPGIDLVRAAGGAVDVTDIAIDSGDVEVRVAEIEQQLLQRRLPSNLPGLLDGLGDAAEEYREGPAWEQAVRLATHFQIYTDLLIATRVPEIQDLFAAGGKLFVAADQWDATQLWVTSGQRDDVALFDSSLISGLVDKASHQLDGFQPVWTPEEIGYVRGLLLRGDGALQWKTLQTSEAADGTLQFDGLTPLITEDQLVILSRLFESGTRIRVGEPGAEDSTSTVPAGGGQAAETDPTDNPSPAVADPPVDSINWAAGDPPLDFALLDPTENPFTIGGPSGYGDGAGVELVLLGTGGSTGGVMEAYAINHNPFPVEIDAEGLVLEPVLEVDDETLERIEQVKNLVSRGKALEGVGMPPGVGFAFGYQVSYVAQMTLEAYCLEFDLDVPQEGMLFRIADRETQEAHADSRRIFRAAEELSETGAFTPDSDPTLYFHSITQWAVWSAEKELDPQSFEAAFVGHVRESAEAAGQEWTAEIEEMVVGLAPNRWADVSKVLDSARR